MTTFLGCIADDFTGATDPASLLARSGANVSLRIGTPEEAPSAARTAAFETIALKIRTSPVADAVAEARKAPGVRQLTIGPEIAPGVPWAFCESGGHMIALTLKSGNFGAESFFTDALAKLEAA